MAELLADAYDEFIFDLDGVIYVGDCAVPHAVEIVNRLMGQGKRVWFATNNASRHAETVLRHLRGLGIDAHLDSVVTSAQVTAVVAAQEFATGRRIRVLGSQPLAELLLDQGFELCDDNAPADLVVQGHDPNMTWSRLSVGLRDLLAGARWLVTNDDLTIPVAEGLALGNGSFVQALTAASGRNPERVVGKPHAAMLDHIRVTAPHSRFLVVGDRFDTDIEWANSGGVDSLLVDTGVHRISSAGMQVLERTPTWVCADLRGIFASGEPIGRPLPNAD